jgi:hypothetical protein
MKTMSSATGGIDLVADCTMVIAREFYYVPRYYPQHIIVTFDIYNIL